MDQVDIIKTAEEVVVPVLQIQNSLDLDWR
jgi:hypothetical protein